MEFSCFIIKPEATKKVEDILEQIRDAGLQITGQVDIQLDESALLTLYPGVEKRPELFGITKEHLLGKTCRAGIVEGKDAINRLLSIAGSNKNPAVCQRGSIRNQCGDHRGLRLASGGLYFFNAIHRSTSKEEADRDFELIVRFS